MSPDPSLVCVVGSGDKTIFPLVSDVSSGSQHVGIVPPCCEKARGMYMCNYPQFTTLCFARITVNWSYAVSLRMSVEGLQLVGV